MSGGFITGQAEGEHQVVIFTFVGELKREDVDQWNDDILQLKQRFGTHLQGVTLTGQPTPAALRRR